MKLNNPFAGFEQFALSTEEVAMVKGGDALCGNQNTYWCTTTFIGDGGKTITSGGIGCGSSASSVSSAIRADYISSGVDEIVESIRCNPY